MALVATVVQKQEIKTQFDSNKRHILGTLAFDASYPTGGETLIKSQIGLSDIESLTIFPWNGNTFEYDSAANKVIVYTATGTEAANASDQSANDVVPFIAVGDV